ncbi:amidohydrolase family protein [Lactiplantibacillus plantarum]|uniref:amidohydrolase family protein n=1 Tax=Lactiplantibacillus plantarum TaxID=1590 RepID=UPI0006AD75D8|nr:amidohydrolase family protein [Lactiplantibacillus plantarum]ALC09906.1 amidohydrolase [Lactiplantibacillus plantarum]MCG0630062.1 amidohydrolase [Lactiplantibacillus plantarum]MCT1241064.1 amidohydrolase [Lactiplantibacillus plantarum]MCW6134086.1 amidohydrolase family protein [Lactiplantibacillus plantarum]OBS42035.1 amidohydrolase [Lactiplantibacillus plantarum]
MLYNKIDVHAHYLSPGYKKFLKDQFNDMGDGVKTPDYSIDTTLSIMDKTKIDYSIISISSPHINTGEASGTLELANEVNDYALTQHRKYAKKIGFFASVPMPYVDESVQVINQVAKTGQAAGFTLPTNSRGTYLGDPKLDPMMQALDDAHAIVALHPNAPGIVDSNVNPTVPQPILEFFFDTTRTVVNMLVNGIFTRYPNIQFIIPHAGAVLPLVANRIPLARSLNPDLKPEQLDIQSVMGQQYFDVAGMVLSQQLPALLELIDPDKLLYASDTPYTPTPVVLDLASRLETTDLLSQPMKQKMFNQNARKLFSL